MNTRYERKSTWVREELLQLLSLSGTLAGLAITGVTLFRTMGRESMSTTIADDLLALSALAFMLCLYAIFFGLRTGRESWARTLEKVADLLFLLGLTVMVASGFIMVYSVE
jgi:multisubunit Na+/H+ antiporter MnhF subunit